jgi:hypothetical protein
MHGNHIVPKSKIGLESFIHDFLLLDSFLITIKAEIVNGNQTTFRSAIAGGILSAPLTGSVPLKTLTPLATTSDRAATAGDTEISPRPTVTVL